MAAWLYEVLFPCWVAIACLLAGLYGFVIINYLRGWSALPEWKTPAGFKPETLVSIIVPARNEAEKLPACLASIARQSYPPSLFEVIVVDDHSTDGTYQAAEAFAGGHANFRALRLAGHLDPKQNAAFKKKAIEAGIQQAHGELIVTTDADCEAPRNWLSLLASFYELSGNTAARNPSAPKLVFIAAPVVFHLEKNLLQRFQSLDFLGMMGVTGAGIQLGWMNMCNGANLAYPKAIFQDVGGFRGIDNLASGDDMLLMHKMAARYPGRIGFVKSKEAAVMTEAMPDGRSFFWQRIRWASKSKSYAERKVTLILALVFFHCLSIPLSLLLAIWWGWRAIGLFVVLFSAKALFDYVFLGKMARYFDRPDLMKSYFPSQILHIAYIIVIGILSNALTAYPWKGRRTS